MRCEDARKMLKDYSKGFTEEEDLGPLEEHIKGCDICKRELMLWQDLGQKNRKLSSMKAGMPKELSEKVRARAKKAHSDAHLPPMARKINRIQSSLGSRRGMMLMQIVIFLGVLVFLYIFTHRDSIVVPFFMVVAIILLIAVILKKPHKTGK
ncbi:MAG TPA: hypothetical protein ENN43_03220 [bacterium]|nr:hypothetical protein [bacterium]